MRKERQASARRVLAVVAACEELRVLLSMFQHNTEKRARIEAILAELES